MLKQLFIADQTALPNTSKWGCPFLPPCRLEDMIRMVIMMMIMIMVVVIMKSKLHKTVIIMMIMITELKKTVHFGQTLCTPLTNFAEPKK